MLRFFAVLLAAVLIAACGGDKTKTVYVQDNAHSNDTEFKVLIKNYPGTLTVIANEASAQVTGETVTSLGYFPQGSEVVVTLADIDGDYECFAPLYPLLLTDLSRTLVVFCRIATVPNPNPYISYLSWSSITSIYQEPMSVRVETATNGTGALLGYTMNAISSPEGSTFTQTSTGPAPLQFFTVDTVGDYLVEVRAYTESGISAPVTFNFSAVDRAPSIYNLKFVNSDIYTDTDIEVTVSVYDDAPADPEVYYEWTINDVTVDGIDGNTLSSSLFKKGDAIAVQAFADDGLNVASSNTIRLTVKDSPSSVDISGLPATISRGTLLDVAVAVIDKDAEDVVSTVANLVYGPPGMSIEDGHLLWDANPILLSTQGTFLFGVALDSAPNSIQEYTLKVEDTQSKTTEISGNGISSASFDNSARLYDYDDDGQLEVLLVSSGGLSIYDYGSGKIEWGYIARQALAGNIRDAVFVPQSSGSTHIAIFADNLVVIDPTTNADIAELTFETPFNSYNYYNSSLSYGHDAAGNGLILAVGTSSYDVRKLFAYDAETHELLWSSITGDLGSIQLVANLDSDPQDEALTSTGYIFDLETGENQWIHRFTSPSPLYVDAIGRNLLVEYVRNSNDVVITDAELKSSATYSLGAGYYVADRVLIADFDNDSDDEIAIIKGTNLQYYEYDHAGSAVNQTTTETIDYKNNIVLVKNQPAPGQHTLVSVGSGIRYSWTVGSDTSWQTSSIEGCFGSPKPIMSKSPTGAASIAFGQCSQPLSFINLDASSGNLYTLAASSVRKTPKLFGMIDADASEDMLFTDYYGFEIYDANLGTKTTQIPYGREPSVVEAVDINNDNVMELLLSNNAFVDIYDVVGGNIIQQLPASTANYSSNVRRLQTHDASGELYLLVETSVDVRVFKENGGVFTKIFEKAYGGYLRGSVLVDTNQDTIPEVAINQRQSLAIFNLDGTEITTSPAPNNTTLYDAAPAEIAAAGLLLGNATIYPSRVVGIDASTAKVVWVGPYVYGLSGAEYVSTTDGYRLIVSGSAGSAVGE